MAVNWEKLHAGLKSGSIRSLARLITHVENREQGWIGAMREIYPSTGMIPVIGITGPAGGGKSTLTSRITEILTEMGRRPGIIAVDPSSPFSGGSLLGDRCRMRGAEASDNVYIRSMSSRGTLGGLNPAVMDAARLMEAFGQDVIVIETVGVGQGEVEIVRTADLVLVVCVPGLGDSVQALKAGLMEIADIYVVNKADKPGADQLVQELESMLDLGRTGIENRPPVLKTSADNGDGVKKLVETAFERLSALNNDVGKKREKAGREIRKFVEVELMEQIWYKLAGNGKIESAVEKVVNENLDTYEAARQLLIEAGLSEPNG